MAHNYYNKKCDFDTHSDSNKQCDFGKGGDSNKQGDIGKRCDSNTQGDFNKCGFVKQCGFGKWVHKLLASSTPI